MATSKVETFIGFALRTGRYKIGVNAIFTMKKANLLILCKSASENTLKDAKKLSKRFNCPLLITNEKLLEDFVHRENAKLMAIADRDLAKAIIEQKQSEFIEN